MPETWGAAGVFLVVAWQTTAFLVAGLLLSLLWNRRPERGHRVLLLAILAAMVAPLLTLGVKALDWGLFVEEPEVAETSESPALTLSSTTGSLPDGALEAVPVLPPVTEPVTAVESSMNWTALSVTVGLWAWVALSLLAVVRVARSVVLGRRLGHGATPLNDPQIERLVTETAKRLNLRTTPRLVTSVPLSCPMIWCWGRRPTLLVPAGLLKRVGPSDWPGIVAHELAHLKRRDHMADLAGLLLTCAVPWNPLAWFSRHRLRHLAERSCDDWALAQGAEPTDYAESLMDLVPQSRLAGALAAVTSKSGLAERVRDILSDRVRQTKAGMGWGMAVTASAAVLVAGCALAQTRGAPPDSTTASAEDQPGVSNNPVPAYFVGEGVSKPGVRTVVPSETTLRQLLEMGGVDRDRLDNGDYAARLITLDAASSGGHVSHSEELSTMLKRSPVLLDWRLSKWTRSCGEPRLILWTGSASDWRLFEKSLRNTAVVVGTGEAAERQAKDRRAQGYSVKIVGQDSPGLWPPQYDELMTAAVAAETGRTPNRNSSLEGIEDESALRQLVTDLVNAAQQNDEGGVAKCLDSRTYVGRAGSVMKDINEVSTAGFKPGSIAAIAIRGDHALVVTPFMTVQDPTGENQTCMVYRAIRSDDRWLILDIDREDVNGLMMESRRLTETAQGTHHVLDEEVSSGSQPDEASSGDGTPRVPLGEVIRQTLVPRHFKQGLVLDLRTGQMVQRQQSSGAYLYWTRLGGRHFDDRHCMVGMDGFDVATTEAPPGVADDLWQKTDVSQLPEFRTSNMGQVLGPFLGFNSSLLPYYFAFKSKAGDIGVVEVTSVDGSSIHLRYKLLE